MLDLGNKLTDRFAREEEFRVNGCDCYRHNSTEWVSLRVWKPGDTVIARLCDSMPDPNEVTITVYSNRRFEIDFTGKDAMWMRRALEVFECVLSDWEVEKK